MYTPQFEITQKRFDPEMKLSEHFTLKEFIISGTAIRLGICNEPMLHHVENLRALCQTTLEPIRRRFGVLRVTSGYRSKPLNDAVGGVRDSQHLYGQAADIFIPNMEVGKKMYEFIRAEVIFDQMILEVDADYQRYWMHISFVSEGNNRQHASMNYIMHHRSIKRRKAA